MYDCAAPGLILGQIIGRWGNFFNAEAYGIAESYDFFGKKIDIEAFSQSNPLRMTIDGVTVHPTFLYESLWCLLIVLLLLLGEKKRFFKRGGDLFGAYLLLYGLERSLVEGLRTDSLYLGPVRISQLLSLLAVLAWMLYMVFTQMHGEAMRLQTPNFSADEIPSE
jgi:phosphatidylglycerol:prolipoprotein diacylglycerol transferase